MFLIYFATEYEVECPRGNRVATLYSLSSNYTKHDVNEMREGNWKFVLGTYAVKEREEQFLTLHYLNPYF